MLPEERKEGSPRFGKLQFPVGLWINSPKKRLKMGRRWPSAGSVRSTCSDTPSRGSDPSEPPKAKPARHKRLSHLFQRASSAATVATAASRWASEKKLAEPSVASPGSGVPAAPQQPPCILKIFGGSISRVANYKSVLATPRCCARQLVREALERYGLNPEDFGQFALCDVVGRPAGPAGGWQGEHLREVGDWERPLLLQELWKPKAGWSRRFEIRRRRELEMERAGEAAEDGEGAALPPPPRRLHRNRSRAASGGPAPPARDPREPRDPAPAMRRSISDLNLSTRRRRKALSLAGAGGDSAATPAPAPPGPPDTAPEPPGEGGPSLELLAQCLIQPPRDRPYFLLDFVLFTMTRPQHIFGRPERRGGPERPAGTPEPPPPEPPEGPPQKAEPSPFSVVDTFLSAPDILPRHCLVQATPGPGGDPSGDPPSATVRPFRGAPATLNGAPLLRRAPLNPGDLLGLGAHVLLLYKDPRLGEGAAPPPWLPPPRPSPGLLGVLRCAGCGRSPRERREEIRGALETPKAELRYRPQDEGTLLREILSLEPGGEDGGEGAGGPREGSGGSQEGSRGPQEDSRGPQEDLGGPQEGPQEDLGALAPAFLLGLCLDHAAREFPAGHLPELLGRVAGMLRETVWEKIKEIGDRQPESPPDGAPPPPLDLAGVTSELRPLLLWLANALELLNLAQGHLQALEGELDIEGPCPELEQDLERCDEALGVLDEVIMSTFQQSVYYLTKTLYSALPALLDTNPFVGPGEPRAGPDLGGVPEGLRPPLAVFRAVLGLSRDCHLHPELASQTFGYLFFFSNASLFNSLMEKGSAGPFFQWWVGVRLRTNLDLVLDGLGALGLGDIAGDFFRKLSATANLLCTPRGCLEQATWARLRAEFPALSPAQLHHVLRHYRLGRGRAAPPAWSPSPEDSAEAATGDIFESFSEHPPLLLPTRGFRLGRGVPLGPGGLLRPLLRLRRRLWELEGGDGDA